MRFPLFVVTFGFVLAEIAGFIIVGKALGVLATLALVLLGAVAGAALLRRKGLATLERGRAAIRAGQAPARPLFDGALQAVAALLIILPGFITDLMGLALFVPAVRNAIWRRLGRGIEIRSARFGAHRSPPGAVVELDAGDYRSGPRPDSPWRDGEPPR